MNRQHRASRSAALAVILLLATAGGAACSSSPATSSQARTQVITDTAGRHVTVPVRITRIVTVGYPPVSDGWIVALGDKNLIVNGFPGYSNTAFYRSDKLLIPGLVTRPNVESALGGPVNTEELLDARPDVVLTADAATANQVQKLKIPALDINYLSSGPAMERDVTVLGRLLGREKQAAAYVSYFNNIIREVHKTASSIPAASRPSAIYLAMDPLQRPNLIMTWMLGVLGVRDVTAGEGMNPDANLQFSVEQLYKWDPKVIIVHDPSDVPALLHGSQFSQLTAVKTKRVNLVPEGVNTWGDNTVEQPLGLLWTAKDIYPKQFASINLVAQTQEFYSRFFGVKLTSQQASDLINSKDGL